ncbi:MAG: DUF1028 domain-containing protein [Gammaproteobacteria bacterium]|nr:DUF1028 domain-containing protein [Gammaproteobacteria bacterium]
MTFSILACDRESGAIGGAAATGSLCVGGWVLRGDLAAGMSASQGASPSTFWGEEVLRYLSEGVSVSRAVEQVTSQDSGREHRQLSAIDQQGNAAAFTGTQNQDTKDSLVFDNGVVAGNMLSGKSVLPAMVDSFVSSDLGFAERLLACLSAASSAGGDYRGLLSAALLVLHPDQPPLTLRIDWQDDDPISALQQLYRKATSGEYANWLRQVPVTTDRERTLV